MKLIPKTLAVAACAGTLMFAGSAFAAGHTTVTITGDVSPTCVFKGGPYSIPFGTLDPASTVDAVQSTTISYQCTNGTAASSLKIDTQASPAAVTMTSGSNSLAVKLTWTTPTTTGVGIGSTFGTIDVPVEGRVLVANLNAAVAGVYTATYNVDLLP
jgi:hypothetical protein